VTRAFPTLCSGPAGLALLPGERLITSCGTVIDAKSGNVIANVINPDGTPVSGDEIWYNSGDDRIYFGSNNVAVADGSTYQLIRMSETAIYQGLLSATLDSSTYQVYTYLFPTLFPAPAGPAFGGHSIAADSANNRIFVPVTGAGLKVFVKDQARAETIDNLPGTGGNAFGLLPFLVFQAGAGFAPKTISLLLTAALLRC
jgi:hypothetical protein